MKRALILGTAGHIDHGKTSLVRALTGIDTDRLPEEKRRGITIELGFAHMELADYQWGVVDVPGHEKYVRHMLAGATGMDVALLVVACDDGIKPQTREHLDILKLLRVRVGVVALTKCDLVEPEWIDLLRGEIAALTEGTFLESAEVVPVSARTGAGLDQLRAALIRAAERADAWNREHESTAPFRLSVDRVFPLAGLGTIVTGTVHSGAIAIGEQVEVMPLGLTARVRHLQNHGKEVTHIAKRHRAAINLAGVHHDQVQRGDELAAVGLLQPSRLMSAELAVLPSASKPIHDRTRVKLHLGTAEFTAMVRLLRREPLEPGTSAVVQLFVSRPAATVWGEAFVIRQESPAETIGGGRILNPTARPLKRPTEAVVSLLASLAGEDELQRLAAAIYFAEWFEGTPNEWARLCGVAPRPELLEQLVRQQVIDRVDISGEHAGYVHRLSIQQLADRIVHWLSKLHQRNPLQRAYPYQQLVQTFENRKSSAAAVRLAVDLLVRESRVELAEQRISLAGVGPQLSKAERQLYDLLAERLRSAGLAVPTVKELVLEHPRMGKSIAPLLNLLVESRVLVRLNADLLIHVDTFETVIAQLREAFRRKPHMTLAEIRETLQTTRKYAVPLAEYLDAAGITRRVGDHRAWAQGI